MNVPRRSPWIAALLIAVAFAGCGGDDSDSESVGSTTAERPGPPEPTEPLAEQIPVFERAVAHPDCDLALEVIHPVTLTNPEKPSSRSNCDAALDPIRLEQGVKVVGDEELGTGAVVDTVLDGRRESLIWALDESGRFKWTGAFILTLKPGAGVGSEDEYRETADAFVQAVRDEDCHATFATFAADTRLAEGDERAFCKSFDGTFTASPEGLASRLQEDPDAEPELLGTTPDLAVFGLATAPAGYRTLVVGVPLPGEAPVVIDVIPTER